MNIFDQNYEDYDFADGTPGSVPPAALLLTAFAVPVYQWCVRILSDVAGLPAYWEPTSELTERLQAEVRLREGGKLPLGFTAGTKLAA